MKSYLLIDSTYRNRLQYPNPADFEVPFQTVNSYQNSSVFTSVNPISVYPDYNFQFIPGTGAAATTTDTTTAAAAPAPDKVSMSDFVLDSIIDRNAPHDGSFVQAADPTADAAATPATTTDTTTAAAASATTTDTTTAAAAAPALTFDAATVITGSILGGSTKMPVIDGAVASAFGISVPNTTKSVYTGIGSAVGLLKGLVFYYNNVNIPFPIIGYDPINSIVFLENGIPNFSIPSTYTIHNPSTSSAVYIHGDVTNRSSIVNFNSELYLYDIALNEMNHVESFDYGNNILNLSKPFSKSWAASDPYMLMSKESIANYGRIQPFANNKYTLQTIMKYRFTHAGTGYKAGDIVFVSNTGDDYKTSFHFHVTHIFPDTSIRSMEMLDIGSTNYTASTLYALHRENETTLSTAQILVEETTTAFYCSFVNPRQNLDGFFFPLLLSQQFTVRDSALYVSGNGTIPFKNPRHTPVDIMKSFYTNGVSGIKKVIPISPTEAYILVQSYPSDMLSRFDLIPTPIPDPILGCTDFLILPFSREGVIGLNMTGTLVTQSQSSCYRMSVISLILPNLTIDMNTGPLTSALPFVYLEISNVSSSNGRNRSVIYSNNPYSTNATFICSVSDVNSPLVTQFIKINSDGAVQTIKFSPIDTLRFRVSLYNGQTFETERKDYLVPVQPDPRVQISAMIEIERIS